MAGLSVDIPGPLEVELAGVEAVQQRQKEVERHRGEEEHKGERKEDRIEGGSQISVSRASGEGVGGSDAMSSAEGSGQVVMRRKKMGVARQTQVEGELEGLKQDGSMKAKVVQQGAQEAQEAETRVFFGGHGSEDMTQLRLEETSASLAAALEVVEEKIKKEDKYMIPSFFTVLQFCWWWNVYIPIFPFL